MRPQSFGRTDEQWERLIGAAIDWLAIKAHCGMTLPPYSELNRALAEVTDIEAFDLGTENGRNGIAQLLSDINERTIDDVVALIGRPAAISSLVVHKQGMDDNDPIGKGFYTWGAAHGLGLPRTATRQQRWEYLQDQQIGALAYFAAKRRRVS